jgi:hypothetical protein
MELKAGTFGGNEEISNPDCRLLRSGLMDPK